MGAWVLFFQFLIFFCTLERGNGVWGGFIKHSLFVKFFVSTVSFLLLFLLLKQGGKATWVFLSFYFRWGKKGGGGVSGFHFNLYLFTIFTLFVKKFLHFYLFWGGV
jgi:hypothetical protein